MNLKSELLNQIRTVTAPCHKRLEKITGGNKLLKEGFELAHYKRLLMSHYLFHLEIARHIFACSDSLEEKILDWPECVRIPALAKDLSKLGFDKEKLNDLHNERLSLHSQGFAIGLCYVAEGSALGNQQIYKALSKQRAFMDLEINEFLEVSGTGLSKRWRSFLEIIASLPPRHHLATIHGASSGFRFFEELYIKLSNQTNQKNDSSDVFYQN